MDILIFNKDINYVLETDTFYDNGNFLRKGGEWYWWGEHGTN